MPNRLGGLRRCASLASASWPLVTCTGKFGLALGLWSTSPIVFTAKSAVFNGLPQYAGPTSHADIQLQPDVCVHFQFAASCLQPLPRWLSTAAGMAESFIVDPWRSDDAVILGVCLVVAQPLWSCSSFFC